MKVLSIVGARPNFVKMAPLVREMRRTPGVTPILVHTGQHYDHSMSQQFFEQLDLPVPDYDLAVGSASHAVQTAEVMRRIEPILDSVRPDVVLVVGDVNSTLAAALTAAKLGLRIAHVEAGLRSFDRTMPEEINRLLTDQLADFLFVTEERALTNLTSEGVSPERVHLVGNVMIDALEAFRPSWETSEIFGRLGIEGAAGYAVLTLHRPSNVDDSGNLARLLDALEIVARELPIVFPVHPRVKQQLRRHGDLHWTRDDACARVGDKGILYLDPLGYFDFIALMSRARLVLTDSGGIQEETTILRVPCLTLRHNTERPITVSHGTNRVIGTDPERIVREALAVLDAPPLGNAAPPLWDGKAAMRIVTILAQTPLP